MSGSRGHQERTGSGFFAALRMTKGADGEWILRCTQNDKGSADDGGIFGVIIFPKIVAALGTACL